MNLYQPYYSPLEREIKDKLMRAYEDIQSRCVDDVPSFLKELITLSNEAYQTYDKHLVVELFKPIFDSKLQEFLDNDVFETSYVLNDIFKSVVGDPSKYKNNNNFDMEYLSLVATILFRNNNIITDNVRTKYVDGTTAGYKQYIGYQFRLNNNTQQAHILTSRFTPVKAPISELYWIWRARSNDVDYLNDELKCKFWNEWKRSDGTIGKAYGYQLNQPCFGYKSQVEYIIDQIKNNPNSRRIMTEIWVPTDLKDMALTPCVHLTNWSVEGDILHLQVTQRSCDVALGLVANVFQYSILHRIIAKECGLIPGDLIWNIHNAHIYDRHINRIICQLLLWIYENNENLPLVNQSYVNINCDGFSDFIPSAIEVKNQNPNARKIKYEIAI